MNASMNAPRPAARGAGARRIRSALAFAALVTVSACGVGPFGKHHGSSLPVPCGLVVDGSGSGYTGKGMDVKGKLQQTLVPFLDDRHCASLSFAPVTRSSRTSPCYATTVDLDPKPQSDTDDRDVLRQQARLTALNDSIKLLDCARTQNGSDVIGALARIADDMPSDASEAPASILVVSDFEQVDPQFNLYKQDLTTAAGQAAAVDKLLAERGTPALRDMDIYPVGYGQDRNAKPSDYQGFNAFWNEILTGRAKARVHHDYQQ